jgi:hypothetical protein
MHFNLPSHEESEAQWHTIWGWLPYWPTRLRWRVIIRQVKWICVIVIAPELGIAMAADEFWQAWKLTRRVCSTGFTITHAFFALMGGFVIAVPAQPNEKTPSNEAEIQVYTPESGSTAFKPLQRLDYFSIQSETPSECETPGDQERYRFIDSVAVAIFQAMTQDTEDAACFPRVTEEDIKNQAKSDPLTKAFAVVQCTWLIIQSIGRASQGLPLTELELTTLAFTMCAFIMYAFWWCKPFDAQRHIRLLCSDPETAAQVRSRLEMWSTEERILNTTMETEYVIGVLHGLLGPYLSPEFAKSTIFHSSAVAFSAIHLIAWNWDFPSPAVCNMWRVFSLGATCIPMGAIVFLAVIILAADDIGDPQTHRDETLGELTEKIAYCMLAVYVVCRLGIIVLIFYCFSGMPASVYEAPSWHSLFPHFS